MWQCNLHLWVQDVHEVQKVWRSRWKSSCWEKALVFISKIPKCTQTPVLWYEKEKKFSEKSLLKADTPFRTQHRYFPRIRKRVYEHATVSFCFQKRSNVVWQYLRQHSVATFWKAADVLGYVRLQAASTESTLRGLQMTHASVRCAKK